MSFDDPFGDPGGGLQRDRWDRPIILRPWEEDGPCPDAEGKRWKCYITKAHRHYARASTFAGTLDDGPGLGIWMKRHVALAVSYEGAKDIRAIIAGMDYTTSDLDKRIEEALQRHATRPQTDSLRRANWGTAIHRFTEPDSPPAVPAEILKDVKSFANTLRVMKCTTCDSTGFEVISTEQFVVNDKFMSAGTFDHLVQCVGCDAVRVLDKKTGSSLHEIAMAIQLTTYAHGKMYNEDTGERIDWPRPIDQTIGYIAHTVFESGETHIYGFDLVEGYELASIAADVRARRMSASGLATLVGSY